MGLSALSFPGGKEELAVAAVNLGARAWPKPSRNASPPPRASRRRAAWFEAAAAATARANSRQAARWQRWRLKRPQNSQTLDSLRRGLRHVAASLTQALIALNRQSRARELATITVALLEGRC